MMKKNETEKLQYEHVTHTFGPVYNHDSKILTRDMVEAFIEKIIIYPDKRIEIMWTYSDNQSELMSLIRGGEEIA